MQPCNRCRTKGVQCRVDSGSSTAKYEDIASPLSQHSTPPQQQLLSLPPDTRAIPSQHTEAPPYHHEATRAMQPPLSAYASHTIPTNEDPSLVNFLINSVVRPAETTTRTTPVTSNLDWAQNYNPRDLMDFSQDLTMDFNDLDTVLKGEWDGWLDPSLMAPTFDRPVDQSQRSDVSTPSIDDSINLGTAAYNRSAWRWVPNHEQGNQDQTLASVLVDSRTSDRIPRPRQIALTQPLDQQERDRIVALLLAGCEKNNYQRIVSLFPSAR